MTKAFIYLNSDLLNIVEGSNVKFIRNTLTYEISNSDGKILAVVPTNHSIIFVESPEKNQITGDSYFVDDSGNKVDIFGNQKQEDIYSAVRLELIKRGFSEDKLLNNRGLVGATIEETMDIINKTK
jgi:hypothetical protein